MNDQLNIRMITEDEIPVIVYLAHRTWPATYNHILSEAQITYMMELFYDPASLKKQMVVEQHRFLIAECNGEAVAFASYGCMNDPGRYKLYKIYTLPNWQGRGIGKLLIDYIIADIKMAGGFTLALNVNRNNNAKFFYEKLDFRVTGEEDKDIGNGYFMNDFVMQRNIY